jgi:hypothetical protein
MEVLLNPLNNLLIHATISYIFFIAGLVSCIFLTVSSINNWYKKLPIFWPVLILLLMGGIWYFGFMLCIGLIGIVVASLAIGIKLFKFDDNILLAFFTGFFTIVTVYITGSLLISPYFGMVLVLLAGIASVFYKLNENVMITKQLKVSFVEIAQNVTVVDAFIITVCFLVSSQPQIYWDAVQANLYIAKWYVATNSLQILPEAISSLFPQTAILYYAFFYQLGGFHGVQVAILLPLLMLLVIIPKIVSLFTTSVLIRYLTYSIIFLPNRHFSGSQRLL